MDRRDPRFEALGNTIQAGLDAWRAGDTATATRQVDRALLLAMEWDDPEVPEVARRLQQIRRDIESGKNPDDFVVVDVVVP
jgi:hypothetical protein